MATRRTRRGAAKQPEGKVRRSQLLTTYGPGALVDLVDHAVIINGTDRWKFGRDGGKPLSHPHLRDRIAARLKGGEQALAVAEPFRVPPDGDDDRPTPTQGVTAQLFPRWFVCQNPKCRALTRYQSLTHRKGRFEHECGWPCVPVRFVKACAAGHIDDLNWIGLVHQGPMCDDVALTLEQGKTGDFSEVKVKCEGCHRERALIDLLQPGRQPNCQGKRPWLGPDSDQECDLNARLIVRTASSAYFSQVDSALVIPDPALYDAVKGKWGVLVAATPATLPAFRQIPDVGAAIAPFSDAQVLEVAELIKAGQKPSRPPIRQAEYATLLAAEPEPPGHIPKAGAEFDARRPSLPVPAGLDRVVLVHKLQEIRVQTGFTRLDFPSPSFSGEQTLGVRTAPLGVTSDWLPAVEIFGEGVFIALDEARLKAWEARDEVQAREAELEEAHATRYAHLDAPPPFPGARFYLLHSLAHLLLTAISLECGYSASAIRERIYCAPADSDQPMAGILLSTATPGTEGTLGGLIDQGRRIGHHLAHALRLGRLCSNDPVCAKHAPSATDEGVDGAACHGCLYVAESSCEFFNRYLDRAFVVPVLGQPAALAYFQEPGWASI